MVWGKAGNGTVSGTATIVTTSTMSDSNESLFCISHLMNQSGVASSSNVRLNNDSSGTDGSSGNYATRSNTNGGNDSTQVHQTEHNNAYGGALERLQIDYISNVSGQEKLIITNGMGNDTSGQNNVYRYDLGGKWDQTEVVTKVENVSSGSGVWQDGTNLTVLSPDVGIPALGTNLQDNTLFIDKVNANRYWFSADNSGFPTNSSNYPDGNNGTNASRIDIPTTGLTSLTNGSVAFWVYPLEAATDAADFVILSGSDSSAASTEMIFGFIGSTSKVGIHARSGGSWTLRLNAGSLPKSQWSHVVYTNSTSSGNKVYVNGAEVTPSYTNGSASSNVFFNNVTTNTFTIGANKDSGGYQWGMEGNVQQVLIYNTTLSASDVTTLYNSGNYNSSPSSTGLLRRYELTSDVNDSSGNSENGTASSISFTSVASPTPATWIWGNPKSIGRAIFASGVSPSTNVIDYITIATTGNASDFGDSLKSGHDGSAVGSILKAVFGGGTGTTTDTRLEYISFQTLGNAVGFGAMTSIGGNSAACGDGTRGIWGQNTVMEYITIDTPATSISFGTLGNNHGSDPAACADSTRGVWGGGEPSSDTNAMSYVTIQTLGNSTDFGDLTVARRQFASCANATRGVWGGGYNGSYLNTLDYATIQTPANASDFGDLTAARVCPSSALSDATRGVWAGGGSPSVTHNTIDYITIDTTGNATDFGDLTVARNRTNGASDYVK